MTKTRKNKKMSTKKKLAIGAGTAASLGGLGYGGYKLGPKVAKSLSNYRAARNAKKARLEREKSIPPPPISRELLGFMFKHGPPGFARFKKA